MFRKFQCCLFIFFLIVWIKDGLAYSKNSFPKAVLEKPNLNKVQHRSVRAVTAKKNRIWDYGIIPYVIDKNFGKSQRALFIKAMRHWENSTCISFVEREPKNHPNFIYFTVKSCGCCSFVGKRGNGRQAISVAPSCEKFGIVVHELGHVIGFWHEHTRPDRDKHVAIERKNIMNGQEYNFNVLSNEEIDSLNMPYNYDSIMHYSRNTFSKSIYLDTIQPLDEKGVGSLGLGQRIRLSEGDIIQANILYKCSICGNTLQEQEGEIISPSFYLQLHHENPELCDWRISGTNGEKIEIEIKELNLKSSENCTEDFLEIRDGYWIYSPLIVRLCGNITSKYFSSESNRMLITYKNRNRKYDYKGFIAKYKMTCGGVINVYDEISLETPNYPIEYFPMKECSWILKTLPGYQIGIKFRSFDIEIHDQCIYDRLEIHDGNSNDSKLIGIYCGNRLPPDIKSTSNQIFLKFITDNTIQKSGISMLAMQEYDECLTLEHGCEHNCINTIGSYECTCFIGYELAEDRKSCKSTCGGILVNNTGLISSPGFPKNYPSQKACIWEIISSNNYSILLNFSYFDIEGSKYYHLGCKYDFIDIYSIFTDGTAKRIGKFCGRSKPSIIVSDTNIMRIEFSSDKSVEKSGFLATYDLDLNECTNNNGGCSHECQNTLGSYICKCDKGHILAADKHSCIEPNCKFNITSPNGRIISPNFPNSYPSNSYCVWRLISTPGHRIKMSFEKFDIESHQECIYDNISIYDGKSEEATNLGVFCGNFTPNSIQSILNEMFIVFKSDNSLQKSGFLAHYTSICGGYLRATKSKKLIYSHSKYGQLRYRKNTFCQWIIQADPDSSVKLIFESFELEFSDHCRYDYLEILDDVDSLLQIDKSHGKYCGKKIPPVIISISDSLVIRFKTDDSMSYKGFLASYTETEPPESTDTPITDGTELTDSIDDLKTSYIPIESDYKR